MDTDLADLIELTAQKGRVTDFVRSLKRVAAKWGWEKELAKCRKLTRSDWDDARATRIHCDQTEFVLILLKSWDHSTPGVDVQSAFLLDKQGRFLDRVSCEINSRLTRFWNDQTLHAVIPAKNEPDGARLIIRLDGESVRGNFAHRIYHGKEESEFNWDDINMPKNQPSVWDVKGLCRLAIKDKKFQILFPSQEQKTNGK